jgi:hypothetical protein
MRRIPHQELGLSRLYSWAKRKPQAYPLSSRFFKHGAERCVRATVNR